MMGRPTKEIKRDRSLTIKFSQAEYDVICRIANEQYRTTSDLVRVIVLQQLKNKGDKMNNNNNNLENFLRNLNKENFNILLSEEAKLTEPTLNYLSPTYYQGSKEEELAYFKDLAKAVAECIENPLDIEKELVKRKKVEDIKKFICYLIKTDPFNHKWILTDRNNKRLEVTDNPFEFRELLIPYMSKTLESKNITIEKLKKVLEYYED